MKLIERVALKHIHYHVQNDSWWEVAVKRREPSLELCDDLERWD